MHSEGCNCLARTAQPDDDLVLCRCEEVSKGEIRDALAAGISTVSGVKRATRAGMGLCQGQTCGRLVAGLVARESANPRTQGAALEPVTARPPVRPTPMGVLANDLPDTPDTPDTPGAEEGGAHD